MSRDITADVSVGRGMIEHVFEEMSDWDLVDVMGEATRDESTAIAQRLAAVAQLYVRRSGALAEQEWCCADHCDAVAAEIAAVQHISHARAVGQVQFACALWHRLPAVARVFVSGVIDFRLVSTIVSRTENVDDAVLPGLDAAIARHCVRWMKLSGPKLRDRVDRWVAKFDPAGVRVPPAVNDNRYVEITPGAAGMADLSGFLRAADGAALDARLEALAGTLCQRSAPHRAAPRRCLRGAGPRGGHAGLPVRLRAVPGGRRTRQRGRSGRCGDTCAGRAGHDRWNQCQPGLSARVWDPA